MSIKVSKKNDLFIKELKLYLDKDSADEVLTLVFDTFSNELKGMIAVAKAKLSDNIEIKKKKEILAN